MQTDKEKAPRRRAGGQRNSDYFAFGIAFAVIAVLQAVQVLAVVAFCLLHLQ